MAVSVKAKMTEADRPRIGRAGKALTIKGYIWPGHEKGSKAVVLKAYRQEVTTAKKGKSR